MFFPNLSTFDKNVRINAAFSGELFRFQLGPERTRNFQPFSTAVQRYPK